MRKMPWKIEDDGVYITPPGMIEFAPTSVRDFETRVLQTDSTESVHLPIGEVQPIRIEESDSGFEWQTAEVREREF